MNTPLLSKKAKKLLMSTRGAEAIERLFSGSNLVGRDQLIEELEKEAKIEQKWARDINMESPVKETSIQPKPLSQQVLQELTTFAYLLDRAKLSEKESQALDDILDRALDIQSPASEYDQAPFFSPGVVEGDILPKVGEMVLIHLARQNEWVAHQVVGFYAWKDHNGSNATVRLFVQVRDPSGNLNARLLYDVLRLDKTPFLA